MDELNVKKNSFTPVLVVILLVAIIGAGAYFYLKNKLPAEAPPITEVTQTETTTAPVDQTAAVPSEEAPPVVVETKTLDIAKPDTPPPSASSTDPAIRMMMGQRSVGNAEAPVKIIEYSSLTCSHCGAFHREHFEKIKAEFVDTGKAQFIFKEFPLNPPALDASMVLRCMPEDKFVNFMNLLFQEQDKWAYSDTYKDSLRQYAKLGGMSDEQFDSCLANTALKEAIIGDMKAGGDQYKVQSTPSFVVNNGQRVLVGNQPIEAFAEAINAAAAAPSTTMPATTDTAPAAEPVAPEQTGLETVTPPSEGEGAAAAAADAAANAAGTAAEPAPAADVPPAE